MSESRYTPGPWRAETGAETRAVYIVAADGSIVCNQVGYATAKKDGRLFDDARLIAAAPDLLEALKEAELQIEYLHGKFSETGSGNAALARIRAAIRKAQGAA